jgi:hypothetical protein
MAQTDITAYTALLKRRYGPGVVNQVFEEAALYNMVLKKKKQDIGGQGFVVGIRTKPNFSASAGTDGGAVGTPGAPEEKQALLQPKIAKVSGAFTDFAWKNATGSANAIKDLLQEQFDSAKDAMTDYLGRQSFSDGFDTIARTGAVVGVGPTVIPYTSVFVNPFMVGQSIDVYDATWTTTKISNAIITAVSPTTDTTGTITIAAALTTVSGDRIAGVGAVTTGVTPVSNCMTGLSGIIGDGTTVIGGNTFGLDTYLGVSFSTTPLWGSQVNDGGAALASDATLETAFSANRQVSREIPDTLVTTYKVRGGYASTLLGDKRFGTNDIAGGWGSLLYQNGDKQIPFFCDKWANANQIYGVNKKSMYLGVTEDIDFLKADGNGILYRQIDPISGYMMGWQFTLIGYMDFACEKRNSNFRIVRVLGNS